MIGARCRRAQRPCTTTTLRSRSARPATTSYGAASTPPSTTAAPAFTVPPGDRFGAFLQGRCRGFESLNAHRESPARWPNRSSRTSTAVRLGVRWGFYERRGIPGARRRGPPSCLVSPDGRISRPFLLRPTARRASAPHRQGFLAWLLRPKPRTPGRSRSRR